MAKLPNACSSKWKVCLLAGVCKCCLLPFPSSPALPLKVPLVSPGVVWVDSQGNVAWWTQGVLALVIFHGGHTEMIFGKLQSGSEEVPVNFSFSFKIKILLFVIWREVWKHVLTKIFKAFSQVFRKPCGFSAVHVLAVPCPSIGISPWSHVFSLIVLHFYHVLLSIFSLNLFLISNSMLLIFLTSVFSWDTS